MSVSSILASGMPVEVCLLGTVPSSTDPLSWDILQVFDPQTLIGSVEVEQGPPNVVGVITVTGSYAGAVPVTVVAVGVRQGATCLFVATMDPVTLMSGLQFKVNIPFVTYPVGN